MSRAPNLSRALVLETPVSAPDGAGGFSVTWQAVGTLNYQVADQVYLSAGYRHMSFDYRKDGMILDVDMTGPLFGATFRF